MTKIGFSFVSNNEGRAHFFTASVEILYEGARARLHGHPDTWAPAEGFEINQVEIFIRRGGRSRRLPSATEDRLSEAECFRELVAEKL